MTIEYSPPETYRNIPLHRYQTAERIERRVKPEIDRVMSLSSIGDLFRYCGDVSCPPEARLLAGAILEEMFSNAAADRLVRPDINLEQVRARTAGLEEGVWQSPWSYGCMGDRAPPGHPQPELRPEPLTREHLERGRRGQP